MTDQFQVVHRDTVYEVEIRVVQKSREFVAVTDYKHSPKEASTPQTVEREIECVHFSHADKQTGINRAIKHLGIMGDFE